MIRSNQNIKEKPMICLFFIFFIHSMLETFQVLKNLFKTSSF
ncbi:hypothetical protein LEP1GSC150_2912 [Leptospira interrogans serovar Copenhageni str. LT2050]|uniref:Uncharacterized protein n=1 Tax=Leptospira interrogans serovar Copenhageni str. LT2050 TaxID=1001598 RepID=M3IRY7_LEPIT|nr:hypothetical protein LEP1GSC150_2912 [Leptospira interrogans serovar Copenhageni str. LT2050]